MLSISCITLSISCIGPAVAPYGRCGGGLMLQDWCCSSGNRCYHDSAFYHQCRPLLQPAASTAPVKLQSRCMTIVISGEPSRQCRGYYGATNKLVAGRKIFKLYRPAPNSSCYEYQFDARGRLIANTNERAVGTPKVFFLFYPKRHMWVVAGYTAPKRNTAPVLGVASNALHIDSILNNHARWATIVTATQSSKWAIKWAPDVTATCAKIMAGPRQSTSSTTVSMKTAEDFFHLAHNSSRRKRAVINFHFHQHSKPKPPSKRIVILHRNHTSSHTHATQSRLKRAVILKKVFHQLANGHSKYKESGTWFKAQSFDNANSRNRSIRSEPTPFRRGRSGGQQTKTIGHITLPPFLHRWLLLSGAGFMACLCAHVAVNRCRVFRCGATRNDSKFYPDPHPVVLRGDTQSSHIVSNHIDSGNILRSGLQSARSGALACESGRTKLDISESTNAPTTLSKSPVGDTMKQQPRVGVLLVSTI